MAPPEIRAQQGQPRPQGQAGPVFMQGQQLGGGQDPNLIGQLEGKLGELEKLVNDLMMLTDQVHKPLGALLVPIAKAGQAFKQEVQKIKAREMQQQGGGQPQSSAQPGGQQGMNVPNPAEGQAPPQAA